MSWTKAAGRAGHSARRPARRRAEKAGGREEQARGEARGLQAAMEDARLAVDALAKEGAGEGELGAALMSLCAAAHAMDLDAETALRSAIAANVERLRGEEKKA